MTHQISYTQRDRVVVGTGLDYCSRNWTTAVQSFHQADGISRNQNILGYLVQWEPTRCSFLGSKRIRTFADVSMHPSAHPHFQELPFCNKVYNGGQHT